MHRQVKAQGRQALCGNVGAALGVLLFPAVLVTLFGLLAALFQLLLVLPDLPKLLMGGVQKKELLGVIGGHAAVLLPLIMALFLLLAPTAVGCIQWFWMLAKGERLPVRQIFCCFETGRRYGKTLWLVLNVELRKLGMLLAGTAPGAAALHMGFSLPGTIPPLLLLGVRLLGVFLAVYGLGVAFTFSRKYFLVYYLAAFQDRPCRELLRESADRMRGQRLRTAVLYVSFLPAVLCCVLLLPGLYVLPYLSATMGRWAEQLLNRPEL